VSITTLETCIVLLNLTLLLRRPRLRLDLSLDGGLVRVGCGNA
jgi:hypothetical protein